MTGARVEITVQDETVLAVFEKMMARMDDPEPALAEIGEYGVQSTRARIEGQNADPIATWAPLSRSYLQSKRKQDHNPDKVLILYGNLVSTFAWQADTEQVGWGSNLVYAAAQQFGLDKTVAGEGFTLSLSTLPARPFLGLSPSDQDKVLSIMEAWLGEPWGHT